jgi:hypothetical protein
MVGINMRPTLGKKCEAISETKAKKGCGVAQVIEYLP